MFFGRADVKVVRENDVLDDDVDFEPLVENSFGEFGDFQLVGHGRVTNDYCGKFLHYKGCLRVELHNLITLDGKDFRGKVFVRKVHHFCNKPSCPICFKSGWAVREAGNIEGRLAEGFKRFGLVEHIICSIPPKDYGLSFEDMRKKAVKVLFSRKVIGGVMIFHAFRYNLRKYWYWSPHFHVLGFIRGGFGRCRDCLKDCLGCSGFKERQRNGYFRDGYIVKVLDSRITVFGTAWYQLNHASVKKNVKRFHVATWFGVCSYRKLKVTVEKHKDICPICKHDLIKLRYFGDKSLAFAKSRDSYEDYEEDGCVVWVERIKHGKG